MRGRLFAFALVACMAVTGYLLWSMRDDGTSGRAPGHEPESAGLAAPPSPPVPAAEEPVDERAPEPSPLTLPPMPRSDPPGPGSMIGFVRSSRGDPVLDAEVTVTPLDAKSPATSARPDAQGFVRVDGLPAGVYRLDVAHPDFASRSRHFTIPEGGGAGPFDIVLVEGGALRVRVLGAYGAALLGEDVRVSRGDGVYDGADLGRRRTDALGEAIFAHLLPGDYRVRRPGEGGASEEMRMATVVPGKVVDVVFEISCGLSGTLLGPDGRPLAGAVVRLTPADFGAEGYRNVEARTNDEGLFELRGFAAGSHRPNVQVLPRREEGQAPAPGYLVSLPVLDFAPGQVRTEMLRVPATVLAGRITRADTGEALRGDEVQISAHGVEVAEGKAPVQKGDLSMAWADDLGRFRFTGLAPGHYQIWVFPIGIKDLSPLTRIVDFTAAGTLEGIDFALKSRRIGRVRLRVLEPDGTPAPGVSFGVLFNGEASVSLNPLRVRDGTYDLEVEAGTRRISVYRKGFRPLEIEVQVPSEGMAEQEVRLVPE
ncbi:MAG: carboxypeptidase-like regulatory domain-containing protein [Planctomycetes bacterium]|nr:carboxypeptidase-like regulatory domain-containing protein [Planctomycetota bacterium]